MFPKNILSIDIGTYQIKLVVGKHTNNTVFIHDAVSLHTPSNSIRDGQIIDIQRLTDVIHPVLMNGKFNVKKVIFTLESTSIITRELFLPYIKPKDFRQMINYEIQQNFPTTLEEYVIQYKKLEDIDEEDHKKSRILVAALPKMVVQNYLELAKKIKLQAFALDSHSNALSKLFTKNIVINKESIKKDEKTNMVHQNKDTDYSTIAIIDLGYENIHMNIIHNGVPQFSRLLAVGGKAIDIRMANTLGISLLEAENAKFKDGRISNPIIKSCVDEWIEEIARIFKFYTSRKPGNKIDKIYFLGGHANLEDISEYIGEYFNIPACKIKNLDNIKIGHLERTFDLKLYLNACGAIIRK